MATVEKGRLSDGALSLEAGCDSGRAPNLLAKNQYAFGINCTNRGSWLKPRPGIRQVYLDFRSFNDAEEAFHNGLFQFAGAYRDDQGNGHLISMHNGRQVKVSIGVGFNFKVSDISLPGDLNPSNRLQAWGCQGENYFIIQDGQTLPYIYNGASARRAIENEIPVGKQIIYYMGRLWVANGNAYVAGDIVGGPSGSSQNGFRDAILKMTENTYLAEGGAFTVPADLGEITCLRPMVNLNTALGEGDLIVGCENGVCATSVPPDRATWKDTQQPLQRVIQDISGMVNQDSVVTCNSDMFYRSDDGYRSLVYAVRYYQNNEWGNTPISYEMSRILDNDAGDFLKFGSAVVFDNRLLATASPGVSNGHGVFHRCLTAMDFTPVTSMNQKAPPCWESIWTGLRILKIIKAKHQGVWRCFIYALDEDDVCGLWEVTKGEKFDNVNQRIEWWHESRTMNFGTMFDRKKLASGEFFIDQLTGRADMTFQFRPDGHPCWIDWDTFKECSKYQTCIDDLGNCPDLKNYREQYRPKIQLKQPPDDSDPNTGEFYRIGFEFQIRTKIIGYLRLKQQRYNAEVTTEVPYGEKIGAPDIGDTCPALLTCCPDLGWFDYRILSTGTDTVIPPPPPVPPTPPVPPNNIAGSLSGTLWKMPCKNNFFSSTCAADNPSNQVVTVTSDDAALFAIKVRIRGVVELLNYPTGTPVIGTGGYCTQGASEPGGAQNRYRLIVSDPPATYHLNNDPVNPSDNCTALDYQFTFQANTGATVTLEADNVEGLENNNLGHLTVDGVGLNPEITQPYVGQFLQMDVLDVSLA